MVNKTLAHGGIFALFLGACSLFLFLAVPNNSLQILKFVRLYAFFICYICIIAPLWWHFALKDFKIFWFALFFQILLLFGSNVFLYFVLNWHNISISSYVHLEKLLMVQCSLTFLLFSLAFLLSQFKISTIWSSFITTLLGFVAMSTLFWSHILLALSKEHRSEIISGILYSNPLIATSICFPNLDYLRSGIFYEICPIVNYAFHYPLWYVLCISYLAIGIVCQILRYFFCSEKTYV